VEDSLKLPDQKLLVSSVMSILRGGRKENSGDLYRKRGEKKRRLISAIERGRGFFSLFPGKKGKEREKTSQEDEGDKR